MTAKIEWYREVLELEPNSKVFFPLARLEAEEGNSDAAISLLNNGIRRHPEFLEARLYLIELLYQAQRMDECNAEIAHLSKMFASYAGFWKAWAACLASEQGNEDTASLLRILAAHFVSGPLKLHEVLNRGLDAMLREGSGVSVKEASAVEKGADASAAAMDAVQTPAGAAEFAENSAAMLADLDNELEDMPGVAAPEALTPEPELPPAEDDNADLPVVEDIEPVAADAEPELPPAADDNADLPVIEDVQPGAEEAELPPAEDDDADLPVIEDVQPVAEEAELPPAEDDDADLPVVEDVQPVAEEAELPPAEDDDADLPVVEDVQPGAPLEDAVAALAEQAMRSESGSGLLEPDEDIAAVVVESPKKNAAPAGRTASKKTIDPEAEAARAEAEMLAGMDLPDMNEPVKGSGTASSQQETGDEFPEDEQFSLRTRSMAEVLAEQGDIQGAIDIYQELADAATSADEVEDIKRRMATLKTRLNMANASAGFRATDEEEQARSKEKLIGMLEALAQRMEVRAGS